MKRNEFLKNGLGFLGMAIAVPRLMSESMVSQTCAGTNSETSGPFPTITPANLVQNNIVGDRTGIDFSINITIKNINNNCLPLEGAIVDIWHCDKDGYYSEYGGTAMQTVDYTSSHFLRGRQVTDANGLVTYTSIFPGWYTSRATHIHVHIYDANGNSLLITQIAFPEGTNSAVVAANSATAYGYTKGMTGYTYNSSDNVFSDGVDSEMSTVTGSVEAGYVLTHEIYVSAAVTNGMADIDALEQFALGQNFPNPFSTETTIPFTLAMPSDVRVEVSDLQGRKIGQVSKQSFGSGRHNLVFSAEKFGLNTGRYVYTLVVSNASGIYTQSKMMNVIK